MSTAALRRTYRRLPNSVRREIALRRMRRWLRASAYIRWHNERVGRDGPIVNFFPMRPEPRMQVTWLLRALRLRIGVNRVPGQPTVAWDTGTWFSQSALRELPDYAINAACTDVSKSRVDAIWAEVAGYSVAVDPVRHGGSMVVKSELNGVHDGRIVAGPTQPGKGLVYQRLIETAKDGRLFGARPVIIGQEIPVVLDFWTAESDRFHGPYHCTARAPDEVYTDVERDQLLEFARRIGMDLGELDVMRDRESSLIYVIDANRTSFMPARLSRADLRRCYQSMVPAMGRLLERQPGYARSPEIR